MDWFDRPQRFLNQTWGYQNPLKCSNIDTNPNSVCSLQNNAAETFESSIWEYSFFVPHDQARLISTFGGPKNFVRRLNYLHDQHITYIGNEPAFLTVFQYHYAGRPALSAKRAHFYIPAYFQPTYGGLPGNDDSGGKKNDFPIGPHEKCVDSNDLSTSDGKLCSDVHDRLIPESWPKCLL